MGGSLTGEITDTTEFATVSWAMTIGSIAPLILLPFLCKKLQKTIGKAVNKNETASKLGDAISAAAFIGIVSAFVARAIAGTTADGTGNAGFMSVAVLVVSIIVMVILELICKKFDLEKLRPFTMPVSMFVGMGSAMLFEAVLPAEIVNFVWR